MAVIVVFYYAFLVKDWKVFVSIAFGGIFNLDDECVVVVFKAVGVVVFKAAGVVVFKILCNSVVSGIGVCKESGVSVVLTAIGVGVCRVLGVGLG